MYFTLNYTGFYLFFVAIVLCIAYSDTKRIILNCF